ncbi:PKD2 [Symbiodinium microadriaticum]|nr:PKD2 [Symbiodinium microadriaticum]
MASVTIVACTWNLGCKKQTAALPGADAFRWLADLCRGTRASLVALGLQELHPDHLAPLRDRVLEVLRAEDDEEAPLEVLASVHCDSYLPLLVFERAPQSNQVLSLPFTFDDKKVCSKGCIAVECPRQGISLCIANAHLEAGHGKTEVRDATFAQIGKCVEDSQHSLFIVLGDLNYRLQGLPGKTIEEPTKATPPDKRSPDFLSEFEALTSAFEEGRSANLFQERCQLRQRLRDGCPAFAGFQEAEVAFLPTYRRAPVASLDPGVCPPVRFDRDEPRLPGWCDRILWRQGRGLEVKVASYSSVESATFSDHRPVHMVLHASLKEVENLFRRSLLIEVFYPPFVCRLELPELHERGGGVMKGGGDKKDVKQGVMVPYDQSAVNDGTDEDTRSIETPNTKRERIKGENLKLCGSITEFFLFLLTFSLAMFLNQSVATSRLSDHIRLKLNPTHHPITRITDVDTLYAYLEDVFVPALYKNSTDIQLAESISPHLKPIDIANRMLGTVRLRQVRVNLEQNCQVLPLFEQYSVSCYPNYSPGTASTTAYGPQERFTFSEDTVGIPYTGALGSYSADGFMQLLASNMSQAMQQIQQLKVDGYMDAATRAFFAELNIWNSNIGLYAVVTFVVEFGASGGTAQEIVISTMTERVLTVGGLGTALDWLAFVLLILVMIFVVQFIFEEVQELYSSWRTYFFDAWNLLDWANMVLLLIGFTLRMLLFSDAANANVGLEQLSNVDSFQNISALASAATTVRVLNAFNCVLLWGKVTKYLRHLPLVKNLIRTVWTAFDLFLPFLIMFGVALVGFVMAFNVGFGDKVAELANFTTSAVYLCRAFLKDVQLMPVYAITPLFGAGLILLFYLNMIAFADDDAKSMAASLTTVAPHVLVEILSYITHDSRRLKTFGVVCKALTATLDEESAWWHLCQRYWYATDDRLKEWPKLSARGLYRALEQWMPLEGFYVLAGAFPWGLIALLRIVEGRLCGYIVRFMPKDDGEFAEVQVPLFEVSIVEDRPGIIRSSLTASWLSGAANLAPAEVEDILAYTQESGIFFSRRLSEAALFTPRRALRLASEAPAHHQTPEKPATTVAGDGSGYAAHTVQMPLNPPSLPDDSEEDRDSDDDARPAVCSSASWRVGELDKSEESLLHSTQEMLRDMLGQFPCDLALIRSPDEFVPLDPSVPGLRPGLYVGDYGHRFYGQFRTEVLLLDYMHLTADELREEVQMPRRLFMRPRGEMPPAELAALAALDMPIDFMRGVKQCGDVHVPLGATTFVAVCSPPQAVAVLAAGVQPPARVLDRQTGQ